MDDIIHPRLCNIPKSVSCVNPVDPGLGRYSPGPQGGAEEGNPQVLGRERSGAMWVSKTPP